MAWESAAPHEMTIRQPNDLRMPHPLVITDVLTPRKVSTDTSISACAALACDAVMIAEDPLAKGS